MRFQGQNFYTQERVGKDGRKFTIMKFRTMVENAESLTGAVYAADNDSRITKIGRFLRKWRLDEIPQLVNVIKGDMSLVGPRPEREVFIKEFEERYPLHPAASGKTRLNRLGAGKVPVCIFNRTNGRKITIRPLLYQEHVVYPGFRGIFKNHQSRTVWKGKITL